MKSKSKILLKTALIVLTALIGLNFVLAPFVRAQTTSGPVQEKKPLFPTIEKVKQATGIDIGQIYTSATTGETSSVVGKNFQSNCWPQSLGGAGFDAPLCLAEIMASAGDVILWLSARGLDITENFFNIAFNENLKVETFNPRPGTMIETGWTILRNTANLLFIFILLIIAIATIIGWETYGIKTALPTLVIIVLLINFSLLLVRYPIEFSNTFAEYFCSQIAGEKCGPSSDKKIEISSLFLKGLSPWSIYEQYRDPENLKRLVYQKEIEGLQKKITFGENCAGNIEECWNNLPWYKRTFYRTAMGPFLALTDAPKNVLKKEWERSTQDYKDQLQRLQANPVSGEPFTKRNIFLTIILSVVFGTIVLLTAAFVFFAAAILLILRIVMLWFAMILAPGALLLWALPATAGYGKKWLTFLFNQAFFFPVMTFFLFLASVFIIGGSSGSITGKEFDFINTALLTQTDPNFAAKAIVNGGFILNYSLLIMMLITSLWFAKSMSAYGADTVYSWGGRAKDWAAGAAQRTAMLGPGLLWKRGVEKLEEKSLGKGTGAKIAGALMGVGRAGRYVATGKTPEEDKEDIKRRFMKYNAGDLPAMYLKASGKTRAAIAERYKDEMGVSIKTALGSVSQTTGKGWGSGIIGRMLKRGLGIAPKTPAQGGGQEKTKGEERKTGGGEYDPDKEEWEKRK